MNIQLRRASSEDEAFLYELYCDTRAEEFTVWGIAAAQQEMILRLQFNARQQSYEFQYPHADHTIILSEDRPVGRMLVYKTAEEFRLVDIALLAECRGAGIGKQMVETLIEDAERAGKPVRLHVEKLNRAIHLYERLGFVAVAETGAYFFMERAQKQNTD